MVSVFLVTFAFETVECEPERFSCDPERAAILQKRTLVDCFVFFFFVVLELNRCRTLPLFQTERLCLEWWGMVLSVLPSVAFLLLELSPVPSLPL